MALALGTRLGPYEVLAAAGAGGMGEVYKARDRRLDRIVAIKILPTAVADAPDLRARFEREAKAISSLNHPNICTLYDVGHQDGIDFLVMEYLEGHTLADRLRRGPLPSAELFTYAIQIADALDRAHRQGMVHRDLKPQNIMLTKGGAKLLDFGLAKLAAVNSAVSADSGVTVTTPLTGEGKVPGTLPYMSPEQLEGKEIDGRSDIFSFGAILYEMATGTRPFQGGGQASLIASIIKEQPLPISQIAPMAPPLLDRVVRQCLEKDPDLRWQTAGDLKRALQWIAEGGSQAGVPAVVSARRRFRERFLWAAVAALAAVAITLGAIHFTQTRPNPKVARWVILPAKGLNTISWPRLSPDGATIAFIAVDSSGQYGIYVRPINSLEPRFLVAVSGENSRPFWSPDSKQLAFFDGNQLKKVAVAGGLAEVICETNGSDGSWGSKGIITFDFSRTDSVRQVPATGGEPTAASTIDHAHGEHMAAWPFFLPDGEHFLFIADRDSSADEYTLKVGSTRTLKSTVLTRVNSRVEYTDGYILYLKGNLLVAHPFDSKKLRLVGEPVAVSGKVAALAEQGLFSASTDGTLIYQEGQGGGARSIVRVNRHGDSTMTIGASGQYRDFALSPDGSRLAYGLGSDEQNHMDIWVRDLNRGVSSRLTFGPQMNAWPVWNPGGTKVLFTSNRTGRFGIYQRNANGTGSDEKLLVLDTSDVSVADISRDGSTALLQVSRTHEELWLYSFATGKAEPFLIEPYNVTRGVFSPDGHYVAYQSLETGSAEIYIQELGPGGGKWQVSSGHGVAPQWRADGRELFYITLEYDFMAVPISYDHGLEIGNPVKLFNHHFMFNRATTHVPYAVTSDGQHFYILAPAEDQTTTQFVVVQNWAEELKQR